MPLEKQNKTTDKREKKHKDRNGRKREIIDRLDREEVEIKRCSHLLERHLCKTSGEKINNIQNCSWVFL